MRRGIAVVALVVATAGVWCSPSEAVDVNIGKLPADDAGLDLSIPENPAFFALGLSPESIARPASPREFGAALLNGLDEKGNFKTGIALAFNPWMVLRGERLTINDYRGGQDPQHPAPFSWNRTLSRFEVSGATAKGTESDDKSLRLSLGFRFVPYTEGDPRMDLEMDKCFMGTVFPPDPRPDQSFEDREKELKAWTDKNNDQLQTEVAACRKAHEVKNWNATGIEVGAAPTWIQKDGTNDSTEWGGGTLWGSFSYGFKGTSLEKTSQLIAGIRYKIDEEVADPDKDGAFLEQNNLQAGLRLRIGQPRLNVSLEGSFVQNDPKHGHSDSGYRFALSPEIKIPYLDNLWLQLAIGATGGTGSDDKVFVTSSVRWGDKSFDIDRLLQIAGTK